MAYEAYDVAVVPFPFSDRAVSKRRPALVLSDGATFNAPCGHSVMAMITSQRNVPRPLDVPILDLDAAGLPAPSVVRFKLFTLDARLVLRTAGQLGADDAASVRHALARLLALSPSRPRR